MSTGICPQCKRPQVVALFEGLCHYHFKSLEKARKASDKPNEKSKVQSARERQYSKIAAAFKAQNPQCQAQLIGCTKATENVHHAAGRIGNNLTDESNFIALCFSCHRIVEENPVMAKALGLSISRHTKTEQ